MIVREVVPGVAGRAVVFAHRPPLALAKIGAPFLPRRLLLERFSKSDVFSGHGTQSRPQPEVAFSRHLWENLFQNANLSDLIDFSRLCIFDANCSEQSRGVTKRSSP